jgi:hypothetical protein
MSNAYPVWWETTVTIFNKFQDPQTQVVRWYKTVVQGAFWKDVGEKVNIGRIVLETNDIICRIRKDQRFLEKYEWLQQPNDTMADYFTLGKDDILIKGEVNDTIDEYTSGKRSTDIVEKYKKLQGCLTIQEVANNTGAGKCNEHYLVKGI